LRVALLHNEKPLEASLQGDAFEEYDSPGTIAAIACALRGLGVEVEPLEAGRTLPARLAAGHYDFAFNIAEGFGRRCREAVAPALCELFGLPYTGSDALTLATTLDKAVARRLVAPDVRVARAVLIVDNETGLEDLRYPVVVKPNDEGSSKGIRRDALVDSVTEARRISRRLRHEYACPVLVEEFLPGAEVTVGILGNGAATAIAGMMEIAPKSAGGRFLYSIEAKRDWRREVDYHIPPRLCEEELAALEQDALTAYRRLGCRDLARIDFRFDESGQPVFLECNALPGLDPDNSDMVLLSRPGMPYECLVQRILVEACKRTGVALP